MWCVMNGQRRDARLVDGLDEGNATRVAFTELPGRERPVAARAFRTFLLDAVGRGDSGIVPAWLDLDHGFSEVLRSFGIEDDRESLRSLCLVGRDYYAHGVMHVKPASEVLLNVRDARLFADACVDWDPELGCIQVPCDGDSVPIAELLGRYGELAVRSRYNEALDSIFLVEGRLAGGACREDRAAADRTLAAFLRGAGPAFSQALWPSFKAFNGYLEECVGEEALAQWLEEQGVEVYVHGQDYSLRATRQSTPTWWNQA